MQAVNVSMVRYYTTHKFPPKPLLLAHLLQHQEKSYIKLTDLEVLHKTAAHFGDSEKKIEEGVGQVIQTCDFSTQAKNVIGGYLCRVLKEIKN